MHKSGINKIASLSPFYISNYNFPSKKKQAKFPSNGMEQLAIFP